MINHVNIVYSNKIAWNDTAYLSASLNNSCPRQNKLKLYLQIDDFLERKQTY